MMEQDWQLKVQSFVDGHLDEVGMKEVAALVARSPEVASLVRELKHTRQALAGYEELRTVPDSREFYWSQIERRIAREVSPEVAPEQRSLLGTLARWLVPVAGAVALAAAGFFVTQDNGGQPSTQWQAEFAGVNALTYYDHEEGMTVMWLTYPTADTVAFEGDSGTLQ
jgi:hypothetical protein